MKNEIELVYWACYDVSIFEIVAISLYGIKSFTIRLSFVCEDRIVVTRKIFTIVNVSVPEQLTRKSLVTMDTRIPSTKGDKLNSEDASAADKVRQHDVDGWLFRKPK